MIELFTAPTPNGWKVSIMLEECGLPYRVRPIDLGRGEQREAWFLAICPNGRIPAIRDEVSIADFALYPWVRAHRWARIPLTGLERVGAWLARMRARPGVERGLSVGVPEGEIDQWSEARKAAYRRGGASMVGEVD